MMLEIALWTLYIIQHCGSVIIDAASNDPNIVVELTNDQRGINEITVDDYWKIYQDADNPLYDWGLKMTLDSQQYSFQTGQDSKLTIIMDGSPGRSECDAFYAFSVGDEYITFAHDFDGGLGVHDGHGIFIYPSCNTNSFATGDASQLIPTDSDRIAGADIRDAVAGGDSANWYNLTATGNGNNFPVIFEFINNDITDTFTFRFKSATFPSGLECVYNSAFTTGEDFKFYFTPDINDETIYIKSFEISGENIGATTDAEGCDCYETQLLSTTTDGEGSRCYLYQVAFCDDELDSVFLERDRSVDLCGADIVSLMTSWEPTDLSFFVKSGGIEGIHVNGLSNGDIFRFCFDSAQVIGTSNRGFIEYYKDIRKYSCPVSNTLFNLCGGGDVSAHSQPMMMRFIWSGLISVMVSSMVVFIAYTVCIKQKANHPTYMKVNENERL